MRASHLSTRLITSTEVERVCHASVIGTSARKVPQMCGVRSRDLPRPISLAAKNVDAPPRSATRLLAHQRATSHVSCHAVRSPQASVGARGTSQPGKSMEPLCRLFASLAAITTSEVSRFASGCELSIRGFGPRQILV